MSSIPHPLPPRRCSAFTHRISSAETRPPSLHRRSGEEDGELPIQALDARTITTRAMTMKRHRKADKLFKQKFGIREDELFLDEYHCAWQKKILIQGRMYVFEHYVCFYANIFGVQQAKVIPLKDVTAVRRARTLGLPNAIEITHRGVPEFFTSYLVSRRSVSQTRMLAQSCRVAPRSVMGAIHQSPPLPCPRSHATTRIG